MAEWDGEWTRTCTSTHTRCAAVNSNGRQDWDCVRVEGLCVCVCARVKRGGGGVQKTELVRASVCVCVCVCPPATTSTNSNKNNELFFSIVHLTEEMNTLWPVPRCVCVFVSVSVSVHVTAPACLSQVRSMPDGVLF